VRKSEEGEKEPDISSYGADHRKAGTNSYHQGKSKTEKRGELRLKSERDDIRSDNRWL